MAGGIYTVTAVNSYLNNLFREDFLLRRIRVRGEVSNVKYHSSGHLYFTLKDAGGTLSAVMFASQRRGLSFRMREGQKVVASGSVEIYERGGIYQLYVSGVEEEGDGELYGEFLRRKAQLEEMGMFAAEYKKPLPSFVSSLGIVTSPTGAAVRDIINIATRRNPYIQLMLYPALVQGERAAESIVRGIRAVDRQGADIIIVGRGGGSIEDLWAFNEEAVARAIFECGTPIVSAVGHETDFTIADFAADLRAPTPSAAAELAVPEIQRFLEELTAYQESLGAALREKCGQYRAALREAELKLRLKTPEHRIREKRMHAAALKERVEAAMRRKTTALRQRFLRDTGRLDMLSPLNRLRGGFAYLTDARGRAVLHTAALRIGDKVGLTLSDGSAEAVISAVQDSGRKPRM